MKTDKIVHYEYADILKMGKTRWEKTAHRSEWIEDCIVYRGRGSAGTEMHPASVLYW
jgi:hypothetical protein